MCPAGMLKVKIVKIKMCCAVFINSILVFLCYEHRRQRCLGGVGREEALLMEKCWAYREIVSVLLCLSAAFVSAPDDLMSKSFPQGPDEEQQQRAVSFFRLDLFLPFSFFNLPFFRARWWVEPVRRPCMVMQQLHQRSFLCPLCVAAI